MEAVLTRIKMKCCCTWVSVSRDRPITVIINEIRSTIVLWSDLAKKNIQRKKSCETSDQIHTSDKALPLDSSKSFAFYSQQLTTNVNIQRWKIWILFLIEIAYDKNKRANKWGKGNNSLQLTGYSQYLLILPDDIHSFCLICVLWVSGFYLVGF